MPFKLNQDRRHRIPRQTHKVTNWAAYDASLRQRGSLTVWFTAEAIEAWAAEPRTTRGGQPRYSALAILTALTLKAVFGLAYRQAEGLIGSIVGLLDLALRAPDHTTLSRRAATVEVPRPSKARAGIGGGEATGPMHLPVDSTGLRPCGAGEWLTEKHGAKRRRSWRKLHLGVDADTGRIVASALTGREVDDGAQVGPLLDQVEGSVASFVGEGAVVRARRHGRGRPPRARAGAGRRTGRPKPSRRARFDYVVHTFEAALWAVGRTEGFENTPVLAVDLGEDADTVGAVTARLAGALYEGSGIPECCWATEANAAVHGLTRTSGSRCSNHVRTA